VVPANGALVQVVKLQRITTNYPAYLSQFYQSQAALSTQPYSVQHAALMRDAYGWSDFWSNALGKLGYEVDEVVSNAEPLQKAWAREHGVRYDENNWMFEITTAQIKAFKPDVLFVTDYYTYSATYLRQLKTNCPSLRLVLGWCGAPYSDASVFKEYDIVLSSVPELVKTFRSQGHRCEQINHAFDPRVLERIQHDEPKDDFTFLGTIAKKSEFHNSRETLIVNLLDNSPLKIWIDTRAPSWRERSGVLLRQLAFDALHAVNRAGVSDSTLAGLPIAGRVRQWKARPSLPKPLDSRIVRAANAPLFGLEMFQQLQRSRISLNTHIDISSTYASNMRLYEATGVGSCLLTDAKSNVSELFEPDAEVVTYAGWEECVEKVEYLLDHENRRRAIAVAGQRRTLREHRFENRAEKLDHVIREAVAEKAS
jgi:spore maturation protein CgeB